MGREFFEIISGGGGGVGNLSGAAATGYDPRYGGIPQVPNPATSSAQAIAANSANLSQLYQLFSGVNTFNAGQAASQLRLNMPNYDALIGQRSGVIGEELNGQVPQDVVDLLIQRGAERGIATGSPGSANSNSAYLRSLGLTSLGQIAKGMNDVSGAIHDTPTAPLANPASMFITPDAIQQAQSAANLYASAPVPSAAAAEARRYGSVSAPKYGGASSGIRTPSFSMAGSGSIYSTPEPQYGTYVGGATGSDYNYQNPSRYDAWDKWYNAGGNANMTGNTPDDGIDWEWWNDASNFGGEAYTPDSIYSPILDASVNPASLSGGGNWYDFSGFDPGF
jgi:hypothetical protein